MKPISDRATGCVEIVVDACDELLPRGLLHPEVVEAQPGEEEVVERHEAGHEGALYGGRSVGVSRVAARLVAGGRGVGHREHGGHPQEHHEGQNAGQAPGAERSHQDEQLREHEHVDDRGQESSDEAIEGGWAASWAPTTSPPTPTSTRRDMRSESTVTRAVAKAANESATTVPDGVSGMGRKVTRVTRQAATTSMR